MVAPIGVGGLGDTLGFGGTGLLSSLGTVSVLGGFGVAGVLADLGTSEGTNRCPGEILRVRILANFSANSFVTPS